MPTKLPDYVWEQRENELLSYVRDHPDARKKDRKEYNSTVQKFFHNSFNEVKLVAGVPRSHIRRNGRRLSESEWKRRRTILLSYVKANSSIGYPDICITPFLLSAYRKFYRYKGGMDQLKSDAGVKDLTEAVNGKNKLRNYLKSSPTAPNHLIRSRYRDVLDTEYNGSVIKARLDTVLNAGMDVAYISMHGYSFIKDLTVREQLIELKRQAFLEWLRRNPETTEQQAEVFHQYASRRIYGRRINDAKRDAGVPIRDINEWRKEFAERRRKDMDIVFERH